MRCRRASARPWRGCARRGGGWRWCRTPTARSLRCSGGWGSWRPSTRSWTRPSRASRSPTLACSGWPSTGWVLRPRRRCTWATCTRSTWWARAPPGCGPCWWTPTACTPRPTARASARCWSWPFTWGRRVAADISATLPGGTMSAEKDGFARFLKHFPKGTVLFTEGDEGEDMYIIRSGRVAIKKRVPHGELVVAELEKGDFFGEMALLERIPRTAGAEMVEDGDLIVIGSDVFGDMVKSNPEIAVRMLRKYSMRLRETTKM